MNETTKCYVTMAKLFCKLQDCKFEVRFKKIQFSEEFCVETNESSIDQAVAASKIFNKL